MKKVFVLLSVLLLLLSVSAGAMGNKDKLPVELSGKQSTAATASFVVDDFESGNLKTPREWWVFDLEVGKVVSNSSSPGSKTVGNNSLLLLGSANNWYVGGVGTYLAKENQDLSKYDTLELEIYGNGPGSGTLKIELLDDDNDNWKVEQDEKNNYLPMYDDKFVADIMVDWKGWKKVSILLDDFVDANEGVGNGKWDVSQKGKSGGLLQVQLICLASKATGKINFNVDNIKLLTTR